MCRAMRYLLILAIAGAAAGADKRHYLEPRALARAAAGTSARAQSGNFDISLMNDGGFTIGTSCSSGTDAPGRSAPLLYGHPFAHTSFPLVCIDGAWKPFGGMTPLAGLIAVSPERISCTVSGTGMTATIDMARSGTDTLTATLTIRNTDAIGHSFAGAFQIDPGMGLAGGDGCAYIGGMPLDSETSLPGASPVTLYERSTQPHGLAMSLVLPDADSIHICNWEKTTRTSGISPTPDHSRIFDLTLRFVGTAHTVQPGDSLVLPLRIALQAADFGRGIFTRWDIPRDVTLDNGMPYPMTLSSVATVFNLSSEAATVSMPGTFPTFATADSLPAGLSVPGLSTTAVPIRLDLRDHYSSAEVFSFSLTARTAGGSTLDSAAVTVHIPVSPYSDTGLTVVIDSSFQSGSDRAVRFTTKRSADNRAISRLFADNCVVRLGGETMQSVTLGPDTTQGASNVDIVFVLDVTGSMSDNIADVQNNILAFADTLAGRGVNYRFAMVTFLDAVENVYPFTADPETFKEYALQQFAHGGDDMPENSLEALLAASRLPFRPNARPVFIWITDAAYHHQDEFTRLSADVVTDTLVQRGINVYGVGDISFEIAFFDPICPPTGGKFFDIKGKFQDVLFDIAGQRGSTKHLLYLPGMADRTGSLILNVHTGGLGGSDTLAETTLARPSAALSKETPALPASALPVCVGIARFSLNVPAEASRGYFSIYDLAGRELHRESVPIGAGTGMLDISQMPARGVYILRVIWSGSTGILGSGSFRFIN